MPKPGKRNDMLDHKKIGALLDIIEQKHGSLTPAAVVQEAAKPTHPLHGQFEWDDSKAAMLHRLNQARTLIRSVRVTVVTENIKLKHVGYVHDPALPPGQAGYAKVLRLKTEAELALEALEAEMTRITGSLRRAHGIAVGLGAVDEVERLEKAMELLA